MYCTVYSKLYSQAVFRFSAAIDIIITITNYSILCFLGPLKFLYSSLSSNYQSKPINLQYSYLKFKINH